MSPNSNRKPPLFSVVIPTYNRQDLIFETLETVFNQKYTNYEVIVVDNASTDDTVKLLQPLIEEGKITLIQNEKNIERARARNVGFKAATGDFLTLLDSDDFMYENNLQDAADFVVNNEKIHFFHNHYELVDSNRNSLNNYRYPSASKQIKRLSMGNFISCIGVFLSKEVYSQFRFNEDEKILGSEDWELWVRVRSSYELGVVKNVNSGVRYHQGRSISSYDLNSIVERKNYIIDHLLKNTKVTEVFGKYEQDMRAAVFVFAATSSNESGLHDEAKKFLKQARQVKPALILDPHFLRVAQIAQYKITKNYIKN